MYAKQLLILMLLICWCTTSRAALKRSQSGGNWSNSTIWGGTLPASGDDVIIAASTVVNLNQSTTNALSSLTIETGAKLIITVNGSGIHIAGDIRNDGELTCWLSNSLKGTIFFHGNSYWSGAGIWNLGMINLDSFSFEFDEGLVFSIADNISGNPSSSINRLGKRVQTIFRFNGTQNANVPSGSSDYFYPSLVLNKYSADSSAITLSFKDSPAENELNILGTLVLADITDRLVIGARNTLIITSNVNGSGTISGGSSSNLRVETDGYVMNPIKLTTSTSFHTIRITGNGSVQFQNSFVVRNELLIDSASCMILPSDAKLTLGVNGLNPTPGNLRCHGKLYAGNYSGLIIRGNGISPVELGISGISPGPAELASLEISRVAGAAEVRLADNSLLVVDGPFEIDADNNLNLNNAKLCLNLTISIHADAYLTGSDAASLIIQGSGGNATLRFNPNGDNNNRTLLYFELSRTAGRIITLANTLYVKDKVNVVSGKLNSNGNLTLVASGSGSADLAELSTAADVLGDVSVQSWLSGGAGMRGTRMLSSPVNDSSSPQSVYQQLQSSVLITGPGGTINGFDSGGNAQPFAPSIQTYYEPSPNTSTQFIPLPDIYRRAATFPGIGQGFFLFFRGNRDNPASKLNSIGSPYAISEQVTLSYKGPINKRDIIVPLEYTINSADPFNGYNVAGNPYPATIDWSKMSRVNVSDMLAIIRPGGGMITYSNGITVNGLQQGAGSVSASSLPLISAGQGFYVRATATGASIMFTEACKAVSSLPDRFLTTASQKVAKTNRTKYPAVLSEDNPISHVLRIELQDGINTDETALVFKGNGNAFLDHEDAVYFSGSTVSLSSISADGVKLAINFLPEPGMVKEVAIYADVTTSGRSKLSFKKLPVMEGYVISLRDNYDNTLVSIHEGSHYEFSIDKTIPQSFGSSRFKLLFEPKLLTRISDSTIKKEDILIYPVPVRNRMHVKLSEDKLKNARFTVYDLNGKKMTESLESSWDMSFLNNGVYVLEAIAESGRLLGRKKFVKAGD